jgi:hypothetical protein
MTENNSDDFCVICYEKENINYDTSMNIIYSNELIDFKHCLNIKVHPKCLCLWLIKSKDNCVVCREKLNICHYVLNDANTFIVEPTNNNYTHFDITYPCKNIIIENNEGNEILNLDILTDISNLNIHNIRSYVETNQLMQIMNNPNTTNTTHNRIIIITFTNKLIFCFKTLIITLFVYSGGLLINQIYNFALSTISDIF